MRMAGHRGASWTAPENTIESNNVAFEQGADGVEFDVWLSADGEVFLMHDKTLKKLGSKTCPPVLCHDGGLTQDEYLEKLDEHVTTLSYWDFIRHVDMGAWKGPEYAGITPPLLKDALAAIPDGKFALCEIKGGDFNLVRAVVSLTQENSWGPDKMHIIGFNLPAMAESKRLLVERGMHNMVWFVKEALDIPVALQDIKTAHEQHLDGIDFLAYPDVVTKEVVNAANSVGMEVAVWVTGRVAGVDTPENAEHIEESGVDVFTSDFTPDIQKWIRTRA